jgi:hypothetical protein
MIGRKFERLTVISAAGRTKWGDSRWLCRCECGSEKIIIRANILAGRTRSCGCLHREIFRKITFRHGHAGKRQSPEYQAWSSLIARCENPKNKRYRIYGARGITVCPEWRESFGLFLSHVGPRPSNKHSIERINNMTGYEPGNVRWATRTEQARNTRINRFLTLNGETHCISAWAEILGINVSTLDARLRRGWTVERALSS